MGFLNNTSEPLEDITKTTIFYTNTKLNPSKTNNEVHKHELSLSYTTYGSSDGLLKGYLNVINEAEVAVESQRSPRRRLGADDL